MPTSYIAIHAILVFSLTNPLAALAPIEITTAKLRKKKQSGKRARLQRRLATKVSCYNALVNLKRRPTQWPSHSMRENDRMIRMTICAATTAAIFALTVPALAQSGATAGGSMSNGAMGNSSMSHDTMSEPTTCQGMMDKAKPMMDSMSDMSKKNMAMNEMHMAQAAMNKGYMKTCMKHMHNAMNDMK